MTQTWLKLLFFCTLVKLGRSALVMSVCNDESLSQNTAIECLELFNEVKAAVKSDANLYLLHNLFYPVVDTPPSIANITYVVTFNNSNSQELKPCPGLDVNSTLNITKTHNYTFGWSASGVYTVVHPALLRMLQPQFPFVILLLVQYFSHNDIKNRDFEALLWDGLKQLNGVELYLVNITLNCVPSDAQLQGTLIGITSVVKDLAELSERDDRVLDDRSNNGFVITGLGILDDTVDRESSEVFTITAVLCSVTLAVIFVLILYFYCYSSSERKAALKPIFRALVLTLLLWSVFEILCDLGMFIYWACVTHLKHIPLFFYFKYGIIFVSMIPVLLYTVYKFPSILMTCCIRDYDELSDVYVAYGFLVGVCFGIIFICNIIPVILLAVVYPVWVTSTMLFITSVFFVSSLLFIYLYKLKCVCRCNHDNCMRCMNCVLLTVSAITFIFGMLIFVVMFQYAVINGKGVANSGTMTHFILSYLPSVLVSILGWMLSTVLVKREN